MYNYIFACVYIYVYVYVYQSLLIDTVRTFTQQLSNRTLGQENSNDDRKRCNAMRISASMLLHRQIFNRSITCEHPVEWNFLQDRTLQLAGQLAMLWSRAGDLPCYHLGAGCAGSTGRARVASRWERRDPRPRT